MQPSCLIDLIWHVRTEKSKRNLRISKLLVLSMPAFWLGHTQLRRLEERGSAGRLVHILSIWDTVMEQGPFSAAQPSLHLPDHQAFYSLEQLFVPTTQW